MSWISLADEVRAIRFLLDGPGADERSGPYNLTAPNPVTNAELTSALRAAFRRPDFRWLRVPAPLLRLGLGEMSSELLTQRPGAAEAACLTPASSSTTPLSAPPSRPS